jgi:hypothetical protein
MTPNEFVKISVTDDSNVEAMRILSDGLSFESEDEYFLKNYHPCHAELNSNLFWLLHQGRFKTGSYDIIVDSNNRYVGSAGWYHHENVIIAMSRTYLSKEYRGRHVLANNLLPDVINFANKNNFPVWMTFNQKNKNIYNEFCRVSETKNPRSSSLWPNCFLLFHPIGVWRVNSMDQYIVQYLPPQQKHA